MREWEKRNIPRVESITQLSSLNIGQVLVDIVTEGMNTLDGAHQSQVLKYKIRGLIQGKFWQQTLESDPTYSFAAITDAIQKIQSGDGIFKGMIVDELVYQRKLIEHSVTSEGCIACAGDGQSLQIPAQEKLHQWLDSRLETCELELQLHSYSSDTINRERVLASVDSLSMNVQRKNAIKTTLLSVFLCMSTLRNKSPEEIIQSIFAKFTARDPIKLVILPLSPVLYLSDRDYRYVYTCTGSIYKNDSLGFAYKEGGKTIICIRSSKFDPASVEHEYQHIIHKIVVDEQAVDMDVDVQDPAKPISDFFDAYLSDKQDMELMSMNELIARWATSYIDEIFAYMIEGVSKDEIKTVARKYNYGIGVNEKEIMRPAHHTLPSIVYKIPGIDRNHTKKIKLYRQAIDYIHTDTVYHEIISHLSDEVFTILELIRTLYSDHYEDKDCRIMTASLLQTTRPGNWHKVTSLLRTKVLSSNFHG